MTEKEILNILGKHLMDHPTAEALVLTRGDICSKLLTEQVGYSIDEESRLVLETINDAKSRLCFYNGLTGIESDDMDISSDYIWGYLNILELLEEVLTFLYRRYGMLHFTGDFGSKWSKEAVLELQEEIKNKHAIYVDQLEKEKRIKLNSTEPRLLDSLFSVAYHAILGDEAFLIFMERFNRASAILRKFQSELQPSQSDRMQ